MVLHCKKERGSVVRKIIVLLLTLFMLSSAVLPVGAVTPTPQVLSLATAREAIAAAVGKDTPGAAVVLLERGELLMCEGFGYADLFAKTLVMPDTVFELGDLSSLFVTLTALSLADEGTLSLDTDIAKYLPADFMRELDLSYPVTVRQLLDGSAGFGGRTFDIWYDSDAYAFASLEEALLADVPEQIAMPGRVYVCSPFGVTLAAFVLEAVTGKDYITLATERVLAPLGMTATHLNTDEKTEASFAVGYERVEGGFQGDGRGRSFAGLYPALGAVSSAADLSGLLSWLLDGTSEKILRATTKRALLEMLTDGVFARNAFGFTAGSGFGGVGKSTCFGAALCIDAASGGACLVLANTRDASLLALPQALFGGRSLLGTLPEGELPALSSFAGKYGSAAHRSDTLVGKLANINAYFVAQENEDGTITFLDMRLTQIAPGVFANADGDIRRPVVQFLMSNGGEVEMVVTHDGRELLPLSVWQAGPLALLLFGLLVLLSAWFVLMGVWRIAAFIVARRRSEYPPMFITVLPDISTAFVSALVLITVLVAYTAGAAALSSFYFTMSVLVLLFGIPALAMMLLLFLGTIPDRTQHHRVAITAVMFLTLAFLTSFFGVSII